MKLTLSVRSFQVPPTPETWAWPPSLPSVPTSRATRVTSEAKPLSWSTIVLIVFFSSRISPLTSTVILRLKSPRATAVVTSAMLRTWAVRFEPIVLTESVRSFQVPATPGTTACTPSRPSVPTSRATRVTSEANERSCSTIVLMVSLSCRISPRTSTVIFLERSPLATAIVTSAMLRTWPGQVRRHRVDVVGQVFPGAGHAGDLRLAAQLALGADLARHAGHFRGEGAQLLDHRVHGFLELKDLALDVDGDLAREVALGDGRRHVGDIADLAGQVRGHRVDVVGQVFPGAGDAGHGGLAAELAVGADLAGHAGHFGGERAELLDHRVDGLFQLQDLAANGDGDLLRQVAVGDGDRHLGDVADLRGEVRRHRVDVVGQVFPGTGHAFDFGLAAEPALGADLASHATDFRGEAVELVDHRVDRVLELEDFAAHVDRDLAREVAAGDGGGDFGDVADLVGQVRRHEVDVVGQVFPGAGHAGHLGLAAQRPFGADLAGHATRLPRRSR